MKKLINSINNAFNGIIFTVQTERNMKIHCIIAIIVIILGIYYKINQTEWIGLIITISLVITSEIINTAIEKTVDLVTDNFKTLAKIAKDVAAGAVLINAIIAVIIGCIIFYDKIFN